MPILILYYHTFILTYQVGKILKYTLSVYQGDKAGKPKSPIAMSRYNMSKIDNKIRSCSKVFVKLDVLRLQCKTPILNTFPITPIHETVVKKQVITQL